MKKQSKEGLEFCKKFGFENGQLNYSSSLNIEGCALNEAQKNQAICSFFGINP